MNMPIKTLLLSSLMIAVGFARSTYTAHTIQPVPPALALSCSPAMVYKVISEKYKEGLSILEAYWDVNSGKLRVSKHHEQALEELFTAIKKTALNASDYLDFLELDMCAITRVSQLPNAFPAQAQWLSGALKKLQTALELLQTILRQNRSFAVLTDVRDGAAGIFARELALLRSKQQATLLEHMRRNNRDYPKDLTFWNERLLSAMVMTRNQYGLLGAEADVLSKQLETLKQVYTKIL